MTSKPFNINAGHTQKQQEKATGNTEGSRATVLKDSDLLPSKSTGLTQSCDVVELMGDNAIAEWKDALDEQEFVNTVIQAIDCLVNEDPTDNMYPGKSAGK